MHSLDSFLICFIERIKRAYFKKNGQKLSDEEMIELLRTCFYAGSCLIWYQTQNIDGNVLSDKDLLIYLCQLQCSDNQILQMIDDGCLAKKMLNQEDWTLDKRAVAKRLDRFVNVLDPVKP